MRTRFVYGPVPSRRLGRSLGVDLVPFKTCSYDCVYCQLGPTTVKTTELAEYVPVDGVLAELAEKLRSGSRPDYIGLAGSGEPTLHSRIGDIISGIKALTSVPVAVLTNGSLLWRPEVRAGLAKADLVLPSLDAGTPSTFERVNRPHPDITFERMTDGLLTFAREFTGEIRLEVFVLSGITDGPDEVRRIAAFADKMRPARVQLNTASRPAAEAGAVAVPAKALEKLRGLFSTPSEVIAESHAPEPSGSAESGDVEAEIVALLGRRPCTVEGIAAGLSLRPNDVLKHLDVLLGRGAIRSERRDGALYYEGRGSR
jgi:wyosine [tRNA(Phe)-imidazoG37] synthetase (radical SAM superfamily)